MLGLSILIPVYNRDVTRLVRALAAQAPDWGGPVEIICLDDGSAAHYRQLNSVLHELAGVSYQELPRNVGRAAARNHLAALAHYEWLLLLDNNVSLIDQALLARYAAATATTTAPVLVGGSTYAAGPPADAATHLRWHYGCRREALAAPRRQQQAYAQFKLKNVLVRAEVFARIKLDESLIQYGHEDTKFGWLLEAAGIPVRHLDNPVLHDGLEPAAVFLANTRQAVWNLARLYRTEGLGTDTKLLRTALALRRAGLAPALQAALGRAEASLWQHLIAPRPRLRTLDLLKLLWMLRALSPRQP